MTNSVLVADNNKAPLRSFAADTTTIVYHPVFGFVSEETLQSRRRQRRKSGLLTSNDETLFSFDVQKVNGAMVVQNANNCTTQSSGLSCQIKSPIGDFWVMPSTLEWIVNEPPMVNGSQTRPWIVAVALLLIAIATSTFFMWQTTAIAPTVAQEELIAPVIIEPMKAVPPPAPVPEPTHEPQTVVKDDRAVAKKVLTQNLGFLKLLGHKDIKNIKGGLKTREQNASPGAGPGGTEGSGGEMLAGVGPGLRKITVGNSGVSGLGGIGTKGGGGGLGGYGETTYSGSGGGALSTVPLSQQASVPSGVDRSLILATLLRYLNQVRACYEEGLKTNPELIGQVTTQFEINGSGGVNFARIAKSTLHHAGVEQCITQRMVTWKFPVIKSGGNVPVTYPFMLRPMRQ